MSPGPWVPALRSAVLIALVATLAYVVGFQFTGLFHSSSAAIGALWSMISGLIVLQATRRDTLSSAWRRIYGTLLGASLSALYLSLLPFSVLGMGVCVCVTALACHAAGVPDHARLATLTVAMIMVLSGHSPTLSPVMSALLRFGEALIGTAMAVLAVLVWPEPVDTPAGP